MQPRPRSRGIFIIVISTKALPGLCEHYLDNRNYRVDRDHIDIDATSIALRRYGHAGSGTLFIILLPCLPSVKQRRAKYNNFMDTTNRILTRGLYFRSDAPHSSNASCRAKLVNGRLGEVQALKLVLVLGGRQERRGRLCLLGKLWQHGSIYC